MKKSLILAATLASFALSSALFADVSLGLGRIESNQTLSIAFSTNSDCYLTVVNDDTNQESAFINIYYNGENWSPYYYTSQGSAIPGVSLTDFSTGGGIISGLPAGSYHFQTSTYTHQTYYQHIEAGYTYEDYEYYGERSLECALSVQ